MACVRRARRSSERVAERPAVPREHEHLILLQRLDLFERCARNIPTRHLFKMVAGLVDGVRHRHAWFVSLQPGDDIDEVKRCRAVRIVDVGLSDGEDVSVVVALNRLGRVVIDSSELGLPIVVSPSAFLRPPPVALASHRADGFAVERVPGLKILV